jgi:cytochrome c
VLATLLFMVALNLGAQALYYVPPPAKPGYVVPGVQVATVNALAAPAQAAEPTPDFATAIPMADAMKGAMIAERCGACHDWTKGGPNKIGPNLYGVVGRPRASHPGFEYSAAMKAKGGTWTYQDIFTFLRQPALFVPGTKMSFAGLPNPQDRLDVIAFLRTQADMPFPLPPSSGGASAPAAAPGAGGTPAPAAP